MKSISAYHIAESIGLRELREASDAEVLYTSSTELMLKTDVSEYLYVAHYGVVAFYDTSDEQKKATLKQVREFAVEPFEMVHREAFRVDEGGVLNVEFGHVNVPEINRKVMHVIFYNMAQSLALDYYLKVAEETLGSIKTFTKELKEYGRLRIRKKKMLQFVGYSLCVKNAVTENLYIFDSPQIVWENEELDQLHMGLVRAFDLKLRFREVENTFGVVDANLGTFHEVLQHRESAILEWIIIILILIEVVDLFLHKMGVF